ncbi:DUF2752 domain-containing protein [Flexivirga alba]|uniref:DUF2752 domain-containing protein n=1 Tax=Flexivirga alba TaxID=702742 RepID=A0ABW2AHI3_9MICO
MTTTELGPAETTDVPLAQRVRGPLLTTVGGVAAMAMLHFYDPHRSGSYAYCPFLTLTGHPCPLCGGLRAMNDLTRGHVVDALLSNAAAVFILCGGAVLIVRWFVRRARGDAAAILLPTPRIVTTVFALAMLVFTVYRWTPWGHWLYQD